MNFFIGDNLKIKLPMDVRYEDQIRGTVKSYDDETGMAIIELNEDFKMPEWKPIAGVGIGLSSRGFENEFGD
jgi:hypothetical protein